MYNVCYTTDLYYSITHNMCPFELTTGNTGGVYDLEHWGRRRRRRRKKKEEEENETYYILVMKIIIIPKNVSSSDHPGVITIRSRSFVRNRWKIIYGTASSGKIYILQIQCKRRRKVLVFVCICVRVSRYPRVSFSSVFEF